jgi:hypothetical protein
MRAIMAALAGKIFERSMTPSWKDAFEVCVPLSIDSGSISKLLAPIDAVL